MESDPKARTQKIVRKLKKAFPDAHCALDHRNAFELLVATVLSAQCTDKRVNMVTPSLFQDFPDPKALAAATLEDIEEKIRSTGFFRSKSKSLKALSEDLVRLHQSRVPSEMEVLIKLRGVGRKTANVVLGNAFGKAEGIVVDTHVGRIARRLGLTRQNDPVRVEKDLILLVKKGDWTLFSHLLISLGRSDCSSRKPLCSDCVLDSLCPKIGVEKRKVRVLANKPKIRKVKRKGPAKRNKKRKSAKSGKLD